MKMMFAPVYEARAACQNCYSLIIRERILPGTLRVSCEVHAAQSPPGRLSCSKPDTGTPEVNVHYVVLFIDEGCERFRILGDELDRDVTDHVKPAVFLILTLRDILPHAPGRIPDGIESVLVRDILKEHAASFRDEIRVAEEIACVSDGKLDLQSHSAEIIQNCLLRVFRLFVESVPCDGPAVRAVIHHELVISKEADDIVPAHNIKEHGNAFRPSVDDIADNIEEIVIREADVLQHLLKKPVLAVDITACVNIHKDDPFP